MTDGPPPVEAAPPARWPMAVRFVLYTSLFFACWNHNVLGIPSAVTWYTVEPRSEYFGYDSFLVLNRLRLAADGMAPAYPLAVQVEADGPTPYTSQVGAQGLSLGLLQQLVGGEPRSFGLAAVAGFGLLTAALYAGIFTLAGRRFGPVASDVAAVLAAPAPLMLQFAPSLYWVPFLMAGPFALMWAFGGSVAPGRRGWGVLLAAIGLTVFAKSLCGYEYIVTVIAAPVAALWYHQHRENVPLAGRWRAALAVGAVGVAGFALALAVHMVQLKAVLDLDPVRTIANRAAYRLQGDARSEVRRTFQTNRFHFLPERMAYAANCFVDYFQQPAVSIPAHWSRYHVSIRLKHFVLLALVAGVVAVLRPCGRDFGGLMGATGIALGAGAAWQVIAANHMCVHTHLNGIVYSLGFLPLALVIVGCGVDAVAGWLGVRSVVPWLLLAFVAGTIATSLLAADRRANEDALSEAAALAAVRELPANAAPGVPSVLITVDQFGSESITHPNLPADLGWISQTVPLTEREPMVFVLGWTSELNRSSRPRSPMVVAWVNGQVLPAWVGRYGRPDVDKSLNRKRPTAAFLLAVPRRLVPDPAALEVFAISANDSAQITAARMPAFQP